MITKRTAGLDKARILKKAFPKTKRQGTESAEWQEGFISPRELALRWHCSRSSADRIATRAGLTRLCLGEGANGIVRYIVEEVRQYEISRMTGR